MNISSILTLFSYNTAKLIQKWTNMAKIISGAQIRAARGILKWSVRELAEVSGISISTIKRVEAGDDIPDTKISILEALHDTFVATDRIRFEGETCVCIIKT